MKRIIILPFAELDIKQTVSYFEEISVDLKLDFIKIIDRSFKEITTNPDTYPIIKYDIRKFIIDRFPFCIYYIHSDEIIYVLAVFHDKRNPKIWQKRRIK
jgi:plasmid stabilization system protein ParE